MPSPKVSHVNGQLLYATLRLIPLIAIQGYRLAPRSGGRSQLTIGGVDRSLYRGEFHTFQGTFLDTFTLRSNSIAVNGRTTSYLSSGILIVPSTVTPTWILDPATTEVSDPSFPGSNFRRTPSHWD
jgi:hypothetical protein